MARDPRPVHPDVLKYKARQAGRSLPADDRDAITRIQSYRQADPTPPPMYPPGLEVCIGHQTESTTTGLTMTSGATNARYIGRAVDRLNRVEIAFNVLVAAVAPTWAELGLGWSQDPPLLATSDLDIYALPYVTDIITRITSTGRKLVLIDDIEEINQGAHLWALIGHSVPATPMQLRSGLADQLGFHYSRGGYRQSNAYREERAFTPVSTGTRDLWLGVKQVQAS